MLGVAVALALGACAAPGATSSGSATGTAGAGHTTTQPTATAATTEEQSMQPLGDNPTDTELIDQLQDSLVSFTEHLGGNWTSRNEEPFVADRDYLDYPAEDCTTNGDYEDDSDGMHFSHTLLGPGHPDPEAALGKAREWAASHGWAETAAGQGTDPDHGGVFVTFSGTGLPLISLNVSTAQSRIMSDSPCSTDPSVMNHNDDLPEWTSPNNRFESPSPTPSPQGTRLGISG